jgi:hypothetical protein
VQGITVFYCVQCDMCSAFSFATVHTSFASEACQITKIALGECVADWC